MNKKIKASFIRQQDRSDCGAACLASIIRFHGGWCDLENLRKLCGTSKQGTTLLGLFQAAQELGFDAEGLQAECIQDLNELKAPAILHVVKGDRIKHYMVYYPHSSTDITKSSYCLGDPATGIINMKYADLERIWESKAVLKLVPTAKFEKKNQQQNNKRKWILALINDDFNLLFISVLIGIAISSLSISTAIFSQKLIDDILPKDNIQKLFISLALVTFLLLIRGCLGYLRGQFMVRQGADFNNRVIQNFYASLLALPKSFFDSRKTGELIARMTDTGRIQTVLSVVVGSMVIDFLMVIVSLSFVFTYSTTIGLILVTSLPIYLVFLYLFNRPIVEAQRGVMTSYAFAESNFVDTIQGIAEIKLMNKQGFFEHKNSEIFGAFQRKIADLGNLNLKFGLISEVIGVAFLISIFGTASWLVLLKELRLGEMVALLSIAGNVIPAVNRLVGVNIQIQEASVVFDRMFEFTSMDKECTTLESPGPGEGPIDLQNVSFRFPGRKQILKNVSFTILKGEIVVLLGESGGGKSTLLQIIQKFYMPEGGKIVIGQNDLSQIDTKLWRQQIGSVPQETKIFSGDLLFNIALSSSPDDCREALRFCERRGFGKYFSEFPQGYLTSLGEEGVNISGGQKQLVAFARALFREPTILLLDEATSSMDKGMEDFVLETLQKEKCKMAILMVTHRSKIADYGDRTYFLENGIVFSK